MPQNVLVSVLGEGEYLQKLIRAILEKEVVPQRNLFLSAKNAAACKAAEGYDEVRICEDELAAMIKSEIVLLTASKREMPTELAKISSSSQKRVVVSVCDSEKVDLAYLTDRIAAATELIAAGCTVTRKASYANLRDQKGTPVPAPALQGHGGRDVRDDQRGRLSPSVVLKDKPGICCSMTFPRGKTYEQTAYSRFLTIWCGHRCSCSCVRCSCAVQRRAV
ncbi:MAG: hypothetical protein ACLT4C_01680 [Butyricicoccus sp.]